MTDARGLAAWIEGLGLTPEVVSDDELRVAGRSDVQESLVVRRADTGDWEVVHDRRISSSSLEPDWHAPWEEDPPTRVLDQTVRQLASVFPMVEGSTQVEGPDVIARLRAPLFQENLTQQAFAITFSSVRKAAAGFDEVVVRRAADLADWQEFEAETSRRKHALDELLEPLQPDSGPPSTSPSTTGAWVPTHEVLQPARAWDRPDPAGTVVATIDPGVPVQVLERQADWAQVLCANGWSGWIDGRQLKPSGDP